MQTRMLTSSLFSNNVKKSGSFININNKNNGMLSKLYKQQRQMLNSRSLNNINNGINSNSKFLSPSISRLSFNNSLLKKSLITKSNFMQNLLKSMSSYGNTSKSFLNSFYKGSFINRIG